MQRTGRKGHAMFRVVVQDSRLTPTSGRVVAQVGHYDPHAKTAQISKEKVEFYLQNGAQPSDRVVKLLKDQGIKLPDWVSPSAAKSTGIRNPDKLRRNQPKEEPVPEAEAPAEEAPATEESAAEAPEA